MPQFTYVSPLQTPERILAFGAQGTGKTDALLRIAEKIPNQHFYIIDTDETESVERALETDYSHLSNVTPFNLDPDDWDGLQVTLDKIERKVEEGDWVSVDSATHPWGAVQSWFVQKVRGTDIEDYFLEVRIQHQRQMDAGGDKVTALGGLEGWMDWSVINPQFRAKFYGRLRRMRGVHLYLTAEGDSVGKDEKDKDIVDRFGPYGIRPVGQKRLGFFPHTVLLFSKGRIGNYKMTTIKDRNRREVENEVFENFATDYLVGIAGWKMAKVPE